MTLQEKRKRWRDAHRKYVLGHKDKIAAISRKYKKVHRVQILSAQKRYQKIRRKKDIQFRIAGNLRSRLGESIKNEIKNGSSIKDLGCSITDFKFYVEAKWTDGMTWENYGRDGWHLDHIVPLASFDLTDKEQFRKACHYTNYQPLWASDNIRKSNK